MSRSAFEVSAKITLAKALQDLKSTSARVFLKILSALQEMSLGLQLSCEDTAPCAISLGPFPSHVSAPPLGTIAAAAPGLYGVLTVGTASPPRTLRRRLSPVPVVRMTQAVLAVKIFGSSTRPKSW